MSLTVAGNATQVAGELADGHIIPLSQSKRILLGLGVLQLRKILGDGLIEDVVAFRDEKTPDSKDFRQTTDAVHAVAVDILHTLRRLGSLLQVWGSVVVLPEGRFIGRITFVGGEQGNTEGGVGRNLAIGTRGATDQLVKVASEIGQRLSEPFRIGIKLDGRISRTKELTRAEADGQRLGEQQEERGGTQIEMHGEKRETRGKR